MDIKKALEKIDEMSEGWDDEYPDYDDDGFNYKRFAQKGSALHPATEDDPRDQPCPTCGEEDVLTRRDVARGYQCDDCADRAEGRIQYESKKPSLKNLFNQLSEDSTAGMKPFAVVDPRTNKPAGAAVLKSPNKSIQDMLKGVNPRDLQIVMTQQGTTPSAGTTSTQTTTGAIQPMKEASDSEPTVNGKVVDIYSLDFADIDTKDYPDFADAYVVSGSFADGSKMSDADLEKFQDEHRDLVHRLIHDRIYETVIDGSRPVSQQLKPPTEKPKFSGEKGKGVTTIPGTNIPDRRPSPLQKESKAKNKKEGQLNEKWGTETKVAPSEKGKYKGKTKAELLKRYNKLKKSGPHKKGSKEYGTMRELSFAIRAKSGWGKVKEAEIPSDQMDMGAGLGAGRSNTVLESNMKKTCEAAYHEGKSHGLGGHSYTCRYDEGTDEHMHYHKGFKEGLDECYGISPMRGVVDEGRYDDFDDNDPIYRGARSVDPMKEDADRYEVFDVVSSYMGDDIFKYEDAVEAAADELGMSPAQVDRLYRQIDSTMLPSVHSSSDDDDNDNDDDDNYVTPIQRNIYHPSVGKFDDQLWEGLPATVPGMASQAMREGTNLTPEDIIRDIASGKVDGLGIYIHPRTPAEKKVSNMIDKIKNRKMKEYNQSRRFDLADDEDRVLDDSIKELIKQSHGVAECDMEEGIAGAVAGGIAGGALTKSPSGVMTGAQLGSTAQDMLQKEGNAFTGALAKTKKGGKFSLGGHTYTDTSDLDEMAFESLDRQLNALLNEDSVSEGISVSISKGNQGGQDTVSVTATDTEADNLLSLVRNAGMGIFADEEKASDYGAPVSHEGHAEVEDHGSVLDIMKKMASIESRHSSGDYEQEDDHGDCGCGQTPCGCDQIDEEESEDQMEFEVAEDASEVAMTDADEEAEAAEDEALAKADQLDEWANDAGKIGTEEAFTTTDDFMLNTISSGLNKKKSTGQTTIPVIAGQKDRMGYNESISDWIKLAGIK